jgi:hypothetical protein
MYIQPWGLAVIICAATTFSAGANAEKGWKKEAVDMRLFGGRQIKAIHYPADKPVHLMKDKEPVRAAKKYLYPLDLAPAANLAPVLTNVIDSPPVDGFVPYVTITVTGANANDNEDFLAYPVPYLTGSYLTSAPPVPFTIGLFDTGAACSFVGYNPSYQMGIYGAGMVTDSVVPLSGATGTVNAWASYPMGVFADSLNALEPNGMMLTNISGMKGETNVSVIVGAAPIGSAPDLPTAVGAPVAVFFDTFFDNEHKVSRTQGTTEYRGPDIRLFEHGDPAIPALGDSSVTLAIKPTSSTGVSYIPTIDLSSFEYYPASPSLITDGMFTESLFFVGGANVDGIIYRGFMFDTGAQVTVIGSSVAGDIGLDTNHPAFEVEIVDVTGESTMRPGFYLDSVQLSATGQQVRATHVPVVYMDVASPEGGWLDGIIGMNLLSGYNMVLEGGSFDAPPALKLKLITKAGDINADGKVDGKDLLAIAAGWLWQTGQGGYNAAADVAPVGKDGIINFRDFAVVASDWGWVRGQ